MLGKKVSKKRQKIHETYSISDCARVKLTKQLDNKSQEKKRKTKLPKEAKSVSFMAWMRQRSNFLGNQAVTKILLYVANSDGNCS